MIGYRLSIFRHYCSIVGFAVFCSMAVPVVPHAACSYWLQNTAWAQVLKEEKEIKPIRPAAFKPVVVLSAAHRKLCRVMVGDAMPAITLPDVDGTEQEMQKLLGKKLTVVVFWDTKHRYALAEFQHLVSEVVKPFAKQGVAVIAIHVGPIPANYKQLVSQYGKGIVCLTDADRSAFGKVATGKLPRTYLLDASGKILWFDLEYSRTTRFDLNNAIRYFIEAPKS